MWIPEIEKKVSREDIENFWDQVVEEIPELKEEDNK